MLIKILIAAAVLVIAFLVVVALQPADFRVTRSAAIAAPPSVIFPRVDNLHQFQEWNPFAKMDPNMKSTFAGPEAGVGGSMAWVGNSQVGEGRMTNIESRPGELVRFKLEFLKPFAATNTAEFTFTPQGNQTVVTWSMTGHNGFMCKAFSMFMDCDKMCGGEFEKGLASLKAASEAAADESAKTLTLVTP